MDDRAKVACDVLEEVLGAAAAGVLRRLVECPEALQALGDPDVVDDLKDCCDGLHLGHLPNCRRALVRRVLMDGEAQRQVDRAHEWALSEIRWAEQRAQPPATVEQVSDILMESVEAMWRQMGIEPRPGDALADALDNYRPRRAETEAALPRKP